MKRLLFRRRFLRYQGGHGKVWDYYRHAAAHPHWRVAIHLTGDSIAQGNPWAGAGMSGSYVPWEPQRHDALFLAGLDWQAWPRDDDALPVINLIQGLRHAQPDDPAHAYLSRRALRICVSQPVADAILATGMVRGPVQVIPAALVLPQTLPSDTRRGILIDATKQPQAGAQLAVVLQAQGHAPRLLDASVPRQDYLQALAACEIAVLLPYPAEGFYLPALEAMALGCAVVVPDCVGNRAYLRPEHNALTPAATVDALAAATTRLAADAPLRARLVQAGIETATAFSQAAERTAFHRLLDDLPALWRDSA